MDVHQYLKELHEERRRIDRLIERIENWVAGAGRETTELPRFDSRRGRKPGMTAEEKRAISERMRKYWAERRRRERAGPD
jgi:hypothetical protein